MKVTINTTAPQSREMYNLSELIKTDCCIDCGTNEKLREVVGKIGVDKSITEEVIPVGDRESCLLIKNGKYTTFRRYVCTTTIPITSINIDL